MRAPSASASGERLPRAWAEIDLGAIRQNLEVLRSHVGPGVHVLLVVKANAYGHGAVEVSRLAERTGVRMLGVGDTAEARELREAGIRIPILVLGTLVRGEERDAILHDGTVTIHEPEGVERLEAEAARLARMVRVHVKVDTGLGRLGCAMRDLPRLLRRLARSRHLRLEGVFTHLANTAAIESNHSRLQLRRFRRALREVEAAGLRPVYVHAAGSAALFSRLPVRFNLVRPGIAIYGMAPRDLGEFSESLRPALALRSQIAHLKDVPRGTPIGYNGLHVTRRRARIATVPIGYNDGVPFRLTGNGRALVRGRAAPIVGSVSMDYVSIDVTAVPGTRVGDVVTIIGRDGHAEIPVGEVANAAGTIPYEIPCSLGRRVARIYVGDEAPPREASAV